MPYFHMSDSLRIEIPNFIAQVSLTDDEATRQEVEMLIGKNGYVKLCKR